MAVHWPSGEHGGSHRLSSGDYSFGSQGRKLDLADPEFVVENAIRVLADPRRTNVLLLPCLRELDGVADDQHRLVDAICPIDADEHVVGMHVKVSREFFVA